MRFKQGDYVRIVARECTTADLKAGVFYRYFGGLCGVIDHIYNDKEVCVKVDLDTLPEDIRRRHFEIQESIKQKWLDSLSAEARKRLTPDEKRFELSYTILVQSSDLEKAKKGEIESTDTARPIAIKSVRPLNVPNAATTIETTQADTEKHSSESKQATKATATDQETKAKSVKKGQVAASSPPKRTSKAKATPPQNADDLTPAELAFLREREKAMKRQK